MKQLYVSIILSIIISSCSSTESAKQEENAELPLYGHEVVERIDQPAAGTIRMGFLVHPDTIKQHGGKNVLTALTTEKCGSPCYADLWDNRAAFQLNGENPYGKRTDKWQKQHYAFIADHLVTSKMTPDSDELINYPLTYDSSYKRWGGKLKH